MLAALLHVLEIAALAGSWALAGYRLLPRSLRRDDPLLVWSSALTLGAGATAISITALAALHILGRSTILAVTGGVLVLAISGARQAAHSAGHGLGIRPGNWSERAALLVLGGVLALTLLSTLAPPSSMDATVYHLWAPREFLRSHSWTGLDGVHSYQPLYVQMLFAQGLAIDGGVLAALTHWTLGVGAIVAAGAWGRRLKGNPIWATVIFGASGLFVWEARSAFIDLGLALFSSLAVLWATRPERAWSPLVLAGLFAGLAGGTKFTGLISVALASLSGLAIVWPDWRQGLRRAVVIGGLGLLVALPWYLRNFIYTGNPIYPLANDFFNGVHIPFGGEYGLGRDLLHLVSSPFDMLARGDRFDQGWSVGPAILALLPLGLASSRGSRPARVAVAVVAAWWIIWFFSSPQARLLLPVLPIAAGLASVGMRAVLQAPSRALRWGAMAALAISAAGALGTGVLSASVHAKAALGLESADHFLETFSWNYVAYENANRLLPPDAKVAVKGASNLYYLERAAGFRDPRIPAAELRAQGYTHGLVVHECPFSPAVPPTPSLWEGSYPLRFSRLLGGVRTEVCARLFSIPGPTR